MKYENLTEENKDYIAKIHGDKNLAWSKRLDLISEYLGISTRTVMRWVAKLGLSEGKNIKDSQVYKQASNRVVDKSKTTYIIGWAQNGCNIHSNLWNNIKTYADYHDADIHIIPGVYRSGRDKSESWWDPKILDYLDASRQKIHKYVTILGDVKAIPTAKYPLTGFEAFADDGLIVVGHPKMHLRTLPRLEGNVPKYTVTTGTLTHPKYTDSKAGSIAEFYHMYGFLIVEIEDDKTFHFRQVNADRNGNFVDLVYEVKNSEVSKIDTTSAVVLGDVHEAQIDENVDRETLELLRVLNPKNVILHDLFDGLSITHHDRSNPIRLYQKTVAGDNILKKEIEDTIGWVEKYLDYNPVVISSNHVDVVDKWIIDADWKKDPVNALEYASYLTATLEGKAEKGIIAYELEKKFGKKVKCLARDESFRVRGYELSNHGDIGVNGSRGNPRQYANLGIKNVIGHGHSVTRYNGSMSVGTMTPLRINYNKGPSSWSQGHVLIHNNGRAQNLIFAGNGKVTTFLNGVSNSQRTSTTV